MQITTDPQNESLIEVDKNNNIIGKISRKDAHQSPDKYYRTICVIVKNQQEQILLQQRSATKDLFPNCWDLSVGGHVNWGQEYIQTAIKELFEELAISSTKEHLKFLKEVLVKLPNSNEYFHVFEDTLKSNDIIKLSEDEVSHIKWMTIAEVKESMAKQPFLWYERPMQLVNAIY